MTILTREQLYAWVWSIPATKVAAELGISGTALAKKCRLNGIPTPGRGYWRQLQQGKKVERTSLSHQEAGNATFLGEVTEERADSLNKLVLAMVDSVIDSDSPENANRPSHATDAQTNEPGYTEATAAEVLSKVPGVGKISVPQPGQPIGQLKTFLEPAEVLALAAQAELIESAHRFIVALSAAGQECDSPTRAVLALWRQSAMVVLDQSSPIDRLIKDCQGVAAGRANPAWFTTRLKSSKMD